MTKKIIKITATLCLFIILVCIWINAHTMQAPQQVQSHLPSMVLIELGEHKGMRSLGIQIKSAIDEIIKEELEKLIQDKKALLKYPESGVRSKLVLSLYYIGKVDQKYEAALVHSLDLMQSLGRGLGPLGPLTISNDFDFFGNDDEIVVKVNDPSATLQRLHDDIKDALFSLNDYYRKDPTLKIDLFPLDYGDKYAFIPHITFSRVPCKSIERFAREQGIDDPKLCQRIKDRIRCDVFPKLSLSSDLKKVVVTSFALWNHQHVSLKSFPLIAYE